ncbi:DUF1349 domain-containing protein [Kitasatospora sp. NPDC057015]|uniref:DUF1349 domain-containing protein n=1 Tax=Kitasatospora sp. NPDC057015 TaxID=3346001 RepID=UPI0036302E6A
MGGHSRTYRDGVLTATAAAGSDIFTPPFGAAPGADAARALSVGHLEGDWQFKARLRVAFRSAWDAGAIMVWSDDEYWAKLNFEYAPGGHPAIFSVVTRGRSDDAVGWRWTASGSGCASADWRARSPSAPRGGVKLASRTAVRPRRGGASESRRRGSVAGRPGLQGRLRRDLVRS